MFSNRCLYTMLIKIWRFARLIKTVLLVFYACAFWWKTIFKTNLLCDTQMNVTGFMRFVRLPLWKAIFRNDCFSCLTCFTSEQPWTISSGLWPRHYSILLITEGRENRKWTFGRNCSVPCTVTHDQFKVKKLVW